MVCGQGSGILCERPAMNKALWICSLVGAAVGITLGLAVFDNPVLGFALGLGLGALVGASIRRSA